MGFNIKNGNPAGASLCETCSRGFIARGYRESELVVMCQALWPERRIEFRVRTCSGYVEMNEPTRKEMEEIALVLDRVVLKRDAGFVPIGEPAKNDDSAEGIVDKERRRD